MLGALAYVERHVEARTARLLILLIGMAALINGVVQSRIFGRHYFDVYWRTDVQCAPIFLAASFFLFTRQGNTKESPPMPRRRSSAKPKLLVDELGPTLDQQCATYLATGLPPDATEFDRMCFEAMAAFVRISTKPPKPDTEAD